MELVAEIGYDRVTVDAIAARAHASKATMYRKWSTKADLVAAALRRHAEGAGPLVVPDAGGLRADLLGAVGRITRTIVGSGGPSLIGLLEAVRDDPRLREGVRAQIKGASAVVGATICQRAAARGELGPFADGAACMELAVAQLLLTALLQGGAPSSAEQERLVDEVLLPVLRAPRSAADALGKESPHDPPVDMRGSARCR